MRWLPGRCLEDERSLARMNPGNEESWREFLYASFASFSLFYRFILASALEKGYRYKYNVAIAI